MLKYLKLSVVTGVACAAMLAGSGLLATQANAASLNYTFVEIVSKNNSPSQAGITSPTINNNGDVSYTDRWIPDPGNPGICPGDTCWGVRVQNADGSSKIVYNTDIGRSSPINDAGSVLVRRNITIDGTLGTALQRVDADGTTTTLATFGSDATKFDYREPSGQITSFGSMNNNGEVAVSVSTHALSKQIVLISSDALTKTVIDTQDNSARFNFTEPRLNDAGQVAYKAQTSALGVDAYVGNGTTVTMAIDLPSNGFEGNTSANVGINNDGLVIAQTTKSLIVGKDAGTPTEIRNIIIDASELTNSDSIQEAGINNYGQTVNGLSNSSISNPSQKILIGDQVLIKTGDQLFGSTVQGTNWPGDMQINDFGQIVFTADTDQSGPSSSVSRFIVRADPEGYSVENAIVPDRTPAPGSYEIDLSIVNALGVDAPIYVDPIIATGFTYSIGAGGENFASVLVPDALPGGDDTFTVEFGTFSETLTAGTTFDFLSFSSLGFDTFSITGIDVAEMYDPSEPWIVGLTFVAGGFSSVLSIDAITVDTGPAPVPIPAALPLLLSALGLFGFFGWRNKYLNVRRISGNANG